MKQEAQKQFEGITISQIKDILKKSSPDKFDKMIITDDQSLKRGNYVFVKLKYEKVERKVGQIKFPLYGSIKDNFAELEGGEAKHGIKSPINSENLFEKLKSNYQITGNGINSNMVSEPFNYPLEEASGEIAKQQKKYYFPDMTYQSTCEDCTGKKYVLCTDEECCGRHEYECPKCHGNRKVDCRDCNKSGFIKCDKCKGRGEYKCSKCDGKGEIKCGSGLLSSGCGGTGYITRNNHEERCSKCSGRGHYPCSECRDGIIKCAKCSSRGEIRCDDCGGRGEIDCSYCDAAGKIICETCYGDKDRYGMIDCPTCKTMGAMAQVIYVESLVSQNESERIILKGERLKISDDNILRYVNKNATGQIVFKKVNERVEENFEELSKEYTDLFEKDLGLHKNSYPLLTKEEVFYQVVPCIELSYRHMLTNTSHEFTIVNIWDNPEVIYHSEPEELKQDLGNITKSVGGLFGKLFKTKGFKTKEDKKNEISLLIHLAKIDGKIEDGEKMSISEAIGNLEEFTNSEKQKLFDLLNSPTLPALTKNETAFSSKERANEVLEKLTKLAMADGELEGKEKEFIDKLKNMIQ